MKPKESTGVLMTRFYGNALSFIAALCITFNLLIAEFNLGYCLFYASAFFAGRCLIYTANQENQ